jgi:long-chain acyl-CoA synthetase
MEGSVGLSFQEANAMIGGPGSPFEVVDVERDGVPSRSFKNAPSDLRQLFDTARGLDETFIVYEDEDWTFAEVMEEVDALGYALVHHYGVKPGDRVGIAMRNYPEWIISFAAILSIGAISVSMNAWWTGPEMEYAINDAELSVLIGDTERIERAAAACQRANVRMLGVRLDALAPLVPNFEHWHDVVVRGVAMPEVALNADMDATILYTSGTTGVPKGAVSTHGAIVQTIFAFSSGAVVTAARRDPDELSNAVPPCFILIVPLFHVTGCIPVMMTCFSFHVKLVMMYRWEPERVLQLIERHQVTNFVGVPTQSWDLIESPHFGDYDTSTLTSVGGGGAPAPPTLMKRIDGSFKNGRAGLAYGMTETNAYGPRIEGNDSIAHPNSTGPVPTLVMDVEIRDEEMRALGVNENGEIWMRSPTLIRGYWRHPETTASTLVDGWLRSGDLGHIDGDGYLYVEDRVKDMIIRAGENIYSAEVEAAIYEHPAVYEAAVFGLPDERLGEVVACVVMLKPGQLLSADELRVYLQTRLSNFKIPTRVAFSDAPLPRNAPGKMLKREMPGIYFP